MPRARKSGTWWMSARNELAFVAQASSKVMDVQGGERRSGADVRQYSWTGAPTQRWRMENAERGFSRIVNVGSGKCLDLEAARGNDGAEISQVDCHVGQNQQWRIEVSGNDAEWRGYNSDFRLAEHFHAPDGADRAHLNRLPRDDERIMQRGGVTASAGARGDDGNADDF